MALLHDADAAQTAYTGYRAGNDVDKELCALYLIARASCALRVAADGIDSSAEEGVVEQYLRQNQGDNKDDKRHRHF